MILDQYVKLYIEVDTVPVFLYVLAWDQELRRLSFLFPNDVDRNAQVMKKKIVLPTEDRFAYPIKGPIKNKEFGDYNSIIVFVSRHPIESFPETDGFISESDARLKNIDDELNMIGSQNWSSKKIEFWVKEKE